jgi:hypothetical protein
MTRADELRERATYLITRPCGNLAEEITGLLLEVELEVWRKVMAKIETEETGMAKENDSTHDQIWEIRDWCREQKKAL